jgi:cyclopropane-fatty-acyl-phospholipid synthase
MLAAQILKRVIHEGQLRVVGADGKVHLIGPGPGPAPTIRLHDRRLERQLFFNPKLHFGEAYMDGRLTVEDGTL